MRKVLYLLLGFLIAISLGIAYVKWFGGVPEESAVSTPALHTASGANNALMLAVVVFCWVTAFVPLPKWLSVVLGFGIVWFGFAVMAVTGFFVYLQYPNNTLNDAAYTGFLCSIAMVASRGASVLKYMHRVGGS